MNFAKFRRDEIEGMLLPAYTWADAYAKAKDYFANVAFCLNAEDAQSAADVRGHSWAT
jgi:hypothetical protein